MASGYTFPILNSDGTASTTKVDFDDMFVARDTFLDAGLWQWGYNSFGQLGLGDLVHRSSPVAVGSLINWKQVSSGGLDGVTMAIKTDGTLWTWGQNTVGTLGLSDITNRSSPVQVGSLTNWKQITTSFWSTGAIKTDGTLWTWGFNANGQLGQLNVTSYSSPIQVGSLTNWKQFSASTGSYFSAAIKTDGTLWTWGANSNGELGLGDVTGRSSPVQVGSLTGWKQVGCGGYYILAVKTNGTLWAWGRNNNGELGLGDRVHRSSPVQVGSLTNWKLVANGTYVAAAAIKTDGTLWTWGHNTNGTLGLGDITHRSSPVQVGSLTNWKLVGGGGLQMGAIKNDGTLWAWGHNGYGTLGLADITHRSSPVQVGSLTSWKQLAITNFISAIQSPDLPV